MTRERLHDTGTTLLVGAGIAGPVIFTAAFIGQALARPGYSHIADPVSALAAGPNGWMQDLNFFVTGALFIAFAAGVHRAVTAKRLRRTDTGFLMVGGLGLVLAGVFPARDAAGAFATNPAHFTAASLSFVGAGIGLTLVGIRTAGDQRSRGLAGYTALSGVAVVVLFLATGATAIPPDAPLHPWLGLLQRATLVVWFACTIVLAFKLLRSDSGDRPELEEATTMRTPRKHNSDARARLLQGAPVKERHMHVAGVSTALLEAGEGPPMVLLHGQGGLAGLWMPILPALAAAHRVIAPDLPGLGASVVEREQLRPDAVQAWLRELIDRRCDQPPILVGFSLGGQIAARFAAGNNERIAGLVLVDTPGLVGKPSAPPAGSSCHISRTGWRPSSRAPRRRCTSSPGRRNWRGALSSSSRRPTGFPAAPGTWLSLSARSPSWRVGFQTGWSTSFATSAAPAWERRRPRWAMPSFESTLTSGPCTTVMSRWQWPRLASPRTPGPGSRRTWPDDFSTRVAAGDALAALGDVDGAEGHFATALKIAEQADDFVARSDAVDRLRRIGRLGSQYERGRPTIQRRQARRNLSRSQRRRRR